MGLFQQHLLSGTNARCARLRSSLKMKQGLVDGLVNVQTREHVRRTALNHDAQQFDRSRFRSTASPSAHAFFFLPCAIVAASVT